MKTAESTVNRMTAVVVILVGAGLIVSGFRLDGPTLIGDPGAALLPKIAGALLVLLGSALFIWPVPQSAVPADADPAGRPMHVVVGTVAAAIGFVLLFAFVGFTIASAVFVFAVPLIMGARRRRDIAAAALMASLFTLLVGYSLYSLLGIPLPGVLVG